MDREISSYPIYYYISTRAAYDPARTIYLCVPEAFASDPEDVEYYAKKSGWMDIAEQEAAVLIAPIATEGWDREPANLLQNIYNETRNSFLSQNGEAIWGLNGHLMCWETILYAVGYEEGAGFVGRSVISCPNVLAAAALVNGAPVDFSDGGSPSDHWFVPDVSPDYNKLNREIPVRVWMYEKPDDAAARRAAEYFASCGGAEIYTEDDTHGQRSAVWRSAGNKACEVRLISGDFSSSPGLARQIMDECFAHVIRWKNGPDGVLAPMDSKAEFYQDERFIRRSAKVCGTSYGYSVHLPEGMSGDDVKGLPLVFTIHGRGEPAWMFTTKNGWDTLADETLGFVLVSPDSPGNEWFLNRDGEAFVKIVEQMADEFGIDTSRVYLTGFSNGGMITREVGIKYPSLFAAISPWNAPMGDTCTMIYDENAPMTEIPGDELSAAINAFTGEGWELPCAFIYGARDGKAPYDKNKMLKLFLDADGCSARPDPESPIGYVPDEKWGQEHYGPGEGYREGGRFTTLVWHDGDGCVKVTETIMKDMPHGAIYDESLAAWEFIKHFRRPKDSKKVEYI